MALIAMAGLPGTGKSAIAQRLAQALPGLILDKDTIRAALFPPSEIEYSTCQDDLCMQIMFQVARYILGKDPGKHVIFDGRTFSRRYQVDAFKGLALEIDVPFRIIECTCSDRVVRQRLERDIAEGHHPAANRDYTMYLSVKARFEPIAGPKLVVNTEEDLECCVRRCLDYVRKPRAMEG